MKNKSISNRLVLFVTIFYMLISTAKAQAPSCNYDVQNPGGCTIVVNVDFYDSGFALCGSSGPQAIGSGLTYPFTCLTCTQPLTNVIVSLITVNEQSPVGGLGFVDISNLNDAGGLTGPTCITPQQYNYTLSWTSTMTSVGY